jgi:hypothetical protein
MSDRSPTLSAASSEQRVQPPKPSRGVQLGYLGIGVLGNQPHEDLEGAIRSVAVAGADGAEVMQDLPPDERAASGWGLCLLGTTSAARDEGGAYRHLLLDGLCARRLLPRSPARRRAHRRPRDRPQPIPAERRRRQALRAPGGTRAGTETRTRSRLSSISPTTPSDPGRGGFHRASELYAPCVTMRRLA